MDTSWKSWRDYDGDGLSDFVLIGTDFVFYDVWNDVTFPGYTPLVVSSVGGSWTDYDANGKINTFGVLSSWNHSKL